jgi:heat shock protein HtpX
LPLSQPEIPVLKTMLLLTLLTLILVGLGRLFAGRKGMIVAFVLAAVMNFGSYWFSDRIVLSVYRAQEVTEAESPLLYRTVERLAERASLPMPRVYVIPSPSPNAFATGRGPRHAAVAATAGILKILTPEELEGVIAHELAHVENRDVLISSVAATLAGAISLAGSFLRWSAFWGSGEREGGLGTLGRLIAGIVAPVAAVVVQMAVSRSREYEADADGAAISGKPLALARALAKLNASARRIPMSEAGAATAHLFIVNPLRGSFVSTLFSTHPPIEERIARLERMAAGGNR